MEKLIVFVNAVFFYYCHPQFLFLSGVCAPRCFPQVKFGTNLENLKAKQATPFELQSYCCCSGFFYLNTTTAYKITLGTEERKKKIHTFRLFTSFTSR